ncbi:MAG: AmmeMemoRadiSam system protein B [Candidatus Micrarchaeota archaeon]
MKVRKPAAAGTFYPDDADELRELLEKCLDDAKEVRLPGKLRALVVPHAGYIYSGPTAAYGYKALAKIPYKKAIVVGPSHYAMFPGAADSGYDFWETPLGKVKTKSKGGGLISVFPKAHEPEHSVEVQFPFLQMIYGDKITVWPLLSGEVDPAELADEVMKELDDDTVLIASSDLSHFKSYEQAKRIDRAANETVPALDISGFWEKGDACGKTPILMLMQIARKKGWKGRLLDYRNSGDTAGPKDSVVGYGCYAFYEAD